MQHSLYRNHAILIPPNGRPRGESAMTKLDKVRKAIEIQGYVTVNVATGPARVRSVTVVDGVWMTDVLTEDLCGYVRIVKTKDAVLRQAEHIISHEAEIRAARQERETRATAAMMDM